MFIISRLKKKKVERNLIKGVRNNIQRISNSRELTISQEKEIKEYWRELFGIDIPLDWHRYFFKRTGLYSVKYIPTSLYYTELIGRFNNFTMNTAYTDKNISNILLPDQHQPVFILKNMNGYFYADNKPICREEAVLICKNLDDVLIKPALECHGNGVCKFSSVNGKTTKGKTIEEFFSDYKANFIIQKAIHQHERMAALNPSSVNTIRFLTYRTGMEVFVMYAVIRIGRKGVEIDNETAGGISTRIDSDGKLSKYAYGSPGYDNVETTDTGIILEGYSIPSFKKAEALVKEMHLQLPHFDLVGWDIAINTKGEPIIIEYNTWPELSQSANGPAFGDYTERVIKEIRNRPNTRFQ